MLENDSTGGKGKKCENTVAEIAGAAMKVAKDFSSTKITNRWFH